MTPPPYPIDWLPLAQKQFNAHIQRIEAADQAAADRIEDEVLEHIELLANHPEMGEAYAKIKNMRRLVIASTPFIAFYSWRPVLAKVQIRRVVHSSQKPPGTK